MNPDTVTAVHTYLRELIEKAEERGYIVANFGPDGVTLADDRDRIEITSRDPIAIIERLKRVEA